MPLLQILDEAIAVYEDMQKRNQYSYWAYTSKEFKALKECILQFKADEDLTTLQTAISNIKRFNKKRPRKIFTILDILQITCEALISNIPSPQSLAELNIKLSELEKIFIAEDPQYVLAMRCLVANARNTITTHYHKIEIQNFEEHTKQKARNLKETQEELEKLKNNDKQSQEEILLTEKQIREMTTTISQQRSKEQNAIREYEKLNVLLSQLRKETEQQNEIKSALTLAEEKINVLQTETEQKNKQHRAETFSLEQQIDILSELQDYIFIPKIDQSISKKEIDFLVDLLRNEAEFESSYQRALAAATARKEKRCDDTELNFIQSYYERYADVYKPFFGLPAVNLLEGEGRQAAIAEIDENMLQTKILKESDDKTLHQSMNEGMLASYLGQSIASDINAATRKVIDMAKEKNNDNAAFGGFYNEVFKRCQNMRDKKPQEILHRLKAFAIRNYSLLSKEAEEQVHKNKAERQQEQATTSVIHATNPT